MDSGDAPERYVAPNPSSFRILRFRSMPCEKRDSCLNLVPFFSDFGRIRKGTGSWSRDTLPQRHATGAGSDANHHGRDRVLTKRVKDESPDTSEPPPSRLKKAVKLEPHPAQNRDEQFVWPWMGVLVNVPTEWKGGRRVGESGNRLKEQLSAFCPHKVIPLWNHRGHTGNAIVEFGKDYASFCNAFKFENHFEAEGYGKRDWEQHKYRGPEMFGWVARADDRRAPGPIGEHLQKNGDLKTVAELENEGTRKTDKLVANLASEIEVKAKHVQELEFKYNETTTSLDKVMEEKELVLQRYNDGWFAIYLLLFISSVIVEHHMFISLL